MEPAPIHEDKWFGLIPQHLLYDPLAQTEGGDEAEYPSKQQYERRIAELEVEAGLLKSNLRIQKGSQAVSSARIAALEYYLGLAIQDIDAIAPGGHKQSEQSFRKRCDTALVNADLCRSFLERTHVESIERKTCDYIYQLSDVDDSVTQVRRFPQEPVETLELSPFDSFLQLSGLDDSAPQESDPQEASFATLPTAWDLLPTGEVSEPDQEQEFAADCRPHCFNTLISPQSPIPLEQFGGRSNQPDGPLYPPYCRLSQPSSSPTFYPASPIYRPGSPIDTTIMERHEEPSEYWNVIGRSEADGPTIHFESEQLRSHGSPHPSASLHLMATGTTKRGVDGDGFGAQDPLPREEFESSLQPNKRPSAELDSGWHENRLWKRTRHDLS